MRHLLIKLLLRLLGNNQGFDGINNDKVEQWLARQYQDFGFRDYLKKRDLSLLKTLGMGIGGKSYLMVCGQRAEVLGLLKGVEQAHKKLEKKVGSNKQKK